MPLKNEEVIVVVYVGMRNRHTTSRTLNSKDREHDEGKLGIIK